VRYIIFSILAFIFLTGFTLKRTGNEGHPVRFFTSNVTVYVKGEFPADRALLKTALHAWTATCAELKHTLSEDETPKDLKGAITVQWKQEWGEDDPAELGHTITITNARTGEILGTQIEINGNHTFALHGRACTGEFDVATVFAHEFGHAVGLDHSLANGALMTATRAMGVSQWELSPDDEAGYCALYPLRDIEETDNRGGCNCMFIKNKKGELTTVVMFFLILWLVSRAKDSKRRET